MKSNIKERLKRSVLFICLTSGLLACVATGQEQTGTTPATGNSVPVSTDSAKPKKAQAKHVYTNEDIPERAPEKEASGTGSPAGSGNSDQPKAEAKGESKGAKKAASPEAIEAANAKVEKLKHDEDTAASAMKSMESMIAEGGEYRRNTMGDSLEQLKAKLEQIKSDRATAQTNLDKLKGK